MLSSVETEKRHVHGPLDLGTYTAPWSFLFPTACNDWIEWSVRVPACHAQLVKAGARRGEWERISTASDFSRVAFVIPVRRPFSPQRQLRSPWPPRSWSWPWGERRTDEKKTDRNEGHRATEQTRWKGCQDVNIRPRLHQHHDSICGGGCAEWYPTYGIRCVHGLRCLLLLALARPFGLAQIDFLPRCQAIYLALSTMYRHQIQYGSYTARLVLCVCRWICYLHASLKIRRLTFFSNIKL